MESKWLLALLILPVVFIVNYFQYWIISDFRKKIGNLWFFILFLASIALLIIIISALSR